MRSGLVGQWYSADYSTYSISDEAGKYQLTVAGYSGDAGDAMLQATDPSCNVNGMQFTTLDSDNDLDAANCAQNLGGWWHQSCSTSCLNLDTNAQWTTSAGFDVEQSRMWVRFH